MLALLTACCLGLTTPPAMNADGWDPSMRTPEAVAAGAKALEATAAACAAIGDAVVTESLTTMGKRSSLTWECRERAKAWEWTAARGVRFVGVDGVVLVAAKSLPGRVAQVELDEPGRAELAELGVVLPTLLAMRSGVPLAEAAWAEELPGAVVAGSRTTAEGTDVLLIDAAGQGDVLVRIDAKTNRPTSIRVAQRMPELVASHPALPQAAVLERIWTATLVPPRGGSIELPVPGEGGTVTLKAFMDLLDPEPRRLPADAPR